MSETAAKSGSVLGGTLLITGSCVGAGMLGIPIVTGRAGFFPSLLMFIVAWSFMTISALLMVEVNGWFKHQVNIISMAGHSLGQFGRSLSWFLYLFLFYALSVAYISGSGNLASSFLARVFPFPVPDWVGSLFFVVLFGWVVYMGTRQVDFWNRILMFAKIAVFVGLVTFGLRYVQADLLLHTQPQYALFSLPVLVIAFGFHNMIPSIMHYLQGDVRKVKKVIWNGSLLALGIYLIWEVLVLGIVPVEGKWGILESLKADQEASQAMAGVLGASWVSTFAQCLAFFAILTSFLAQSLGLVHFLADGLRMRREGKRESIGLCALALLPPLLFSVLYPQLFFKALNFAGGICANLLFGFLPAASVWIGRRRHLATGQSFAYQVKGGTPLLVGIIFIAFSILFLQISNMV